MNANDAYCPNMPLRGFFYFADIYRGMLEKKEILYSSTRYMIPLPRYVVFYNGVTPLQDDITKLRLSDSFLVPDSEHDFEWTATVININQGKNTELKKSCQLLEEYSAYVDKVREYEQLYKDTDTAIDTALDYCIRNNILAEFLSQHRAEVKNMCLTEFNENSYKEVIYEDGRAKGLAEGRAEGESIGLKKGETIGLAKGEQRLQRLVTCLINDNRQEELFNLEQNKDMLYQEYGIE